MNFLGLIERLGMDVKSGEIFRKAEKLGIVRGRPFVLYTQPRYISIHEGTWRNEIRNCLSIAVEQLFRSLDSHTFVKTTGMRNYTVWILSPKLRSLVIVETKISGWRLRIPNNHSSHIMIWTPDESTLDLIVHHLIFSQNGDPIRDGIDWGKLEAKWDIVRHRAIWNWKKHLEKFSPTSSSNRSQEAISWDESSTRVCEKCGAQFDWYSLFCPNCGMSSEP